MNYDNMELVSDKILLADGSIISAVDGSVIAAADADRAQLYNTMPLIAAKLLQPDGSIINGSDGSVIAPADPDRASLYAAMPVTAVRYITEGGTVIAGVGGGNAVIEWEPSSVELFSKTGMNFYDVEVTSLSLNMEEMLRSIYIEGMGSLASLSFPNLVSVLDEFNPELIISNCVNLVSIDLPKLALIETNLLITGCTNLTTINLPALEEANGLYIESSAITSLDLSALVTIGENIEVTGNTVLESIDLSSLVPTSGGEFYFSWNALTAESVNAILARFVANAEFVSGTVDLSGGTNAAPTGQGLLDCATLTARGVSVTANIEPE